MKILRTGATLIEVLLYVALSSSMLFAITAWIFLSQGVAVRNQAVNATELVGEHIMAEINRAVEGSTVVTVPAGGASGASLTLTMPGSGLNPTSFSLSSGVLSITEGGGSAVRLNPDHVAVTNVSFTNLTGSGSAPVVRVSLTLETGAGAERAEGKLTRTFYLSAVSRQR